MENLLGVWLEISQSYAPDPFSSTLTIHKTYDRGAHTLPPILQGKKIHNMPYRTSDIQDVCCKPHLGMMV